MRNLFRFFFAFLIFFSFFSAVNAQLKDYELLIITPSKYETIAQQFLELHESMPEEPWRLHGCYATVEDIVARYDGKPDFEPEPSPAEEPPVPASPTLAFKGFDYPPDLDPLPNLCIIKFLRGLLQFGEGTDSQEHATINNIEHYKFAFGYNFYKDGGFTDILHDFNGNGIPYGLWDFEGGVYHPKFQYLLILGDTGAAGGGAMSYNGVPESWYVWMNIGAYDGVPWADNSDFPTDFFYASPDYYDGQLDWSPNLIVGRIPIYDLDDAVDTGFVTEIITVAEADITNEWGLAECDVCDSEYQFISSPGDLGEPPVAWNDSGENWAGYELWIVSDGNPPASAGGTGQAAPIGATYLILSNTDTCLRVLGDPSAAGLEAEVVGPPLVAGDGYEIHDNGLAEAQAIYDKNEAYANTVIASGAWNNWYRKVVTAGGDSSPGLFSFWDEFVHSKIINDGFLEGNEIVKLRHTNTDDGDATNDFTVTSLAPYLQDGAAGTDCGLLFLLGGDTGLANIFFPDILQLDDTFINNTDLLTYTSSDNRIPIMVSNTDGHALFDYLYPGSGLAYLSFGAAAVHSVGVGADITGGAIAFIGSTDTTYQGIIPSFDKGVVKQERLYNYDELLSYTMKAFNNAPTFLGDIFAGSPTDIDAGLGPINEFMLSNLDADGTDTGLSFWMSQKTIWTYTLFGDPALPVPYPYDDPIDTRTSAPTLSFVESTLRNRTPQYESHGIGVDEMTGGVIATTINIDKTDVPAVVPEVKITLLDIRRDEGENYFTPGNVPATYDLNPLVDEPGYYFVKVEQPGWDTITNGWSSGAGLWWEKEQWICVQEVNEFTRTNDILVVDDDFGYPIRTTTFAYGYEDWYLKALDNEVGPGNYDVWHVDFDDNLFNTLWDNPLPNTGDDWSGLDVGDDTMHGEVYVGLLNSYAKVIWLTGDFNGYWRPTDPDRVSAPIDGTGRVTWLLETLTLDEQARLKNYLTGGGRLFLSGQGILDDLGCSGNTHPDSPDANNICMRKSDTDTLPITNDFLLNYLYLTDIYSSFTYPTLPNVRKVDGNPILGQDLQINIAGGTGANNQYFFVDAEPSADTPLSIGIFRYIGSGPPLIGETDSPFIGTAATAYYRGRGANVFLPFGFEAINEQSHRNSVMGAILSWFDAPTRTGPGTEPGVPDPGGPGDGGGGVGSLSGCFIATACYGTPMAKEVQALSAFRDEYLLSNSLGRFFVKGYYKFSPQLAGYISQRPVLKNFVRIGLKPLVRFSEKLVEE